MWIKTTDNNCGHCNIEQDSLPDIEKIANRSIKELVENSPGLLCFPHDLSKTEDKIGSRQVFSLKDTTLTTGNIMGFVGVNETTIAIRSRFAQDEHRDYFLHYMLQKVFAINLFDLKHGSTPKPVFDFLPYLFPFYLKKALRQGLYRAYRRQEYNDAHIRGAIDVSRHLRKNIPFEGRVAYRVRERSEDNTVTQLIRHTIECIRQKAALVRNILNADTETREGAADILHATPSYQRRNRPMVVRQNLKPLSHPYFFEYTPLQKICLWILRHQRLKYGQEKDKIYGLLFDGAWLWEAYLNTFLSKCGFQHPDNIKRTGGIPLFKDKKIGKRYPDFWKEGIVADAKYKRLADKGLEKLAEDDNSNNRRNDMNQIITYMYAKRARRGGFIVPSDGEAVEGDTRELDDQAGYGGTVSIWAFPIPKKATDFKAFYRKMKTREEKLASVIEKDGAVSIP